MRTLAVLSVAAGIGLLAALSSIVDAILLRPLPVARPWEIMRVFTASPGQPLGFVSYPDFEDFRKAKSIQGAVAECLIPVAAGEPARMALALAVTPDYFRVLGVAAAFGRMFAPEDARASVMILARGDAGAIGTTRRVGARLYTVIGVAPANFGLDRFLHPDFFIPIRSYGDGKILEARGRRFLTVRVRGVDSAAEIAAIAARLEHDHPDTNRKCRAVVLDERTARLRADRMTAPLAGLLGALAALIFSIGCANACGALLLRGETRLRETALKMALGASHFRLLGESLRESATIAIPGCALGLPFAWGWIEMLRRSIVLPTDFAISIEARVDGRVMALAVLAATLATLICGVLPTYCLAWRMDAWSVLKVHERGGKARVRNVLAMVEIALAAALAATGASLWIGLNTAKHADLGYRTDRVAVMTFDPGQSGYDEVRTRAFYRELMERAKSLPGVRGLALAQSVPLGMTGAQRQIRTRDEREMIVWMNIVTPEYFRLMQIGLVAGRLFDDRDTDVAIVNTELAKRIGVGGTMRVGGRTIEVIGIVGTAKYMRWDEAPRPFFYLPYAGNYASRMSLHLVSDRGVLDAVRSLAPEIPASDVRMLREYFDDGAMFPVKVAFQIAGVTGAAGLLLALAGLYGVVSSATLQRRREIAIRLALGAPRGAVLRRILLQGFNLAAGGAAAGLMLAWLGSHIVRGLVPGTGESWPAEASAAVLMVGTSMLASAIPALRTLGIDAASILREP